MNSRILKKFTKSASVEIERLGISYGNSRFESGRDEENCPEIKQTYNWERKSLERVRGKVTDYPIIIRGTVGYGMTSGYYEPEWDDCDALSLLYDYVFDLFTDWNSCDGSCYPTTTCPKKIRANARHLLNYVKNLPVKNTH